MPRSTVRSTNTARTEYRSSLFLVHVGGHFAGDGAHDVLGGHVVLAADSQIIAQVAFLDAVRAFLALLAEPALFFAVETEVVVAAFAAFARGVQAALNQ